MDPETHSWQPQLRLLEETINTSDGAGLRARWESGRCLLTLREGKQLRRGVLAALAKELGVHRSELTARMKFARKFSTEDEVTKVISQFRTWFAIKQKALIDVRRERQPRTSPIQRVLAAIENIDPSTVTEADLAEIESRVQRIREGFATLKEVA